MDLNLKLKFNPKAYSHTISYFLAEPHSHSRLYSLSLLTLSKNKSKKIVNKAQNLEYSPTSP